LRAREGGAGGVVLAEALERSSDIAGRAQRGSDGLQEIRRNPLLKRNPSWSPDLL
jgi:hypothetical protein